MRRRRQYMNDSSTPQPGGLEDGLARLRARGLSLEQVLELLAQVSIEPVPAPNGGYRAVAGSSCNR